MKILESADDSCSTLFPYFWSNTYLKSLLYRPLFRSVQSGDSLETFDPSTISMIVLEELPLLDLNDIPTGGLQIWTFFAFLVVVAVVVIVVAGPNVCHSKFKDCSLIRTQELYNGVEVIQLVRMRVQVIASSSILWECGN